MGFEWIQILRMTFFRTLLGFTVTQSSIIVITVVERVRTLAETKIHVRSQTRSFQWDHVRELNVLMA